MQLSLRFSKKQSKRAAQRFRKHGFKFQAAYIERRHSRHPFSEPRNQTSVHDFRTFKELWSLVGSQILTLVEEAIKTKPIATLDSEDKAYLTYHYPSIAAFDPLRDQKVSISEQEYDSAYRIAAADLVEIVDTFATNSERSFNLVSPDVLKTLWSLVRILLSSHNVRVARGIARRMHEAYTEAQEAMASKQRADKVTQPPPAEEAPAQKAPAQKAPTAKDPESPRSEKKRPHPDENGGFAVGAAVCEPLTKRRNFSSGFIATTNVIVCMVDLDPPRSVPTNTIDGRDPPADDSISPLSLPPSDADEVEATATAQAQLAPEHHAGAAEEQNESAMQGVETTTGAHDEAAGTESGPPETRASDSALYVYQVALIVVPQLWRSGHTVNMIANALSAAVDNDPSHFVTDMTHGHYVSIVTQLLDENQSWSAPLPNPVLRMVRRNA